MATKKPSKAERRNDFILREAANRATDHVKAYLSKRPMGLGSLNEAEFSQAMTAIMNAMVHMYGAGMSDTFDIVDGRDLQKIE